MKVKKLLAVCMTAAMLIGTTAAAVSAEAGKTPTEADCVDVSGKITNIEEGAAITAYQIIDAKYSGNGFIGYQWVAGEKKGQDVKFTEKGVEGLTDSYVTGIAGNAQELGTLTKGNLTSLNAGTWMLLVTGSDLNKVYNPMVISVYYTEDNSLASGRVDANSNWGLESNDAFAKSSEVPVKKEVNDNDGIGELDQAAVGDTVTFTVTTAIPSYSADSAAKFAVTDRIVKGLQYQMTEEGKVELVVKLNQQPVAAENYTVDMLENNKSFKITFKPEYVKTLANAGINRNLEITYQAVVTEEAVTEVGENHVTVEYDTGSKSDMEYVYTVSFDGIAKKTGVEADAEGLAGAEFTLYDSWDDKNNDSKKDAEELSGNKKVTETKEDTYTIDFKGLDPDKTYYLTETKAPSGYSINDTVYTITFANLTEKEDGEVTYDVLVDGRKMNTITYGHRADAPSLTVQNTKISDLPSTGGIGTTIFTIGGCVIMITAAGLYFAIRKKEKN